MAIGIEACPKYKTHNDIVDRCRFFKKVKFGLNKDKTKQRYKCECGKTFHLDVKTQNAKFTNKDVIRDRLILFLILEGLSTITISKLFGVNKEQVQSVINKHLLKSCKAYQRNMTNWQKLVDSKMITVESNKYIFQTFTGKKKITVTYEFEDIFKN